MLLDLNKNLNALLKLFYRWCGTHQHFLHPHTGTQSDRTISAR